MSLVAKAKSGVFWTFLDTFILRGFLFVVQLWMARVLGPEVFGFMGILVVFINLGNAISDTGMAASLIRSSHVDNKDYSTVFYTNFGISLMIYMLVYLFAASFAKYYSQPELENYIKIYSLSFVVSSFSVIQNTIFTKKLDFKTPALINIFGTISGIFVALYLTKVNYGAWSVIYMYLVSQIISTIILWIVSKWRPKFEFSKSKFYYHFHFGYKLLLSSIINVFFSNIYNLIIGKIFPIKILGYYDRANVYNQYPVSSITSVIARVLYPIFSNIKDDIKKIKEVYKISIQLSFLVVAPVMLFISGISKSLFFIVLGNQWLSIVPFFQILTFASILYPIQYFNVNILNVFGRTDWFLRIEIIKKIFLVAIVVFSFQFGVYFFISSSIINAIIGILINSYYTNKLINYGLREQVKDLLPILIFSLILFFILYFAQNFFPLYYSYTFIVFSLLFSIIYLYFVNSYLKLPSYLFFIEQIKLLRK